ncbi:MAG: hypothetical protein ACOCRO_06260 [Halanaerobiales bacterium]
MIKAYLENQKVRGDILCYGSLNNKYPNRIKRGTNFINKTGGNFNGQTNTRSSKIFFLFEVWKGSWEKESTINAFYEYLDNTIKNELILANISYKDVIDEVRKCVAEELYKKYCCYIENDIKDVLILERFVQDFKT